MAKTGPVTAAGKARSSRNAVRHGVNSDSPVIPHLERESVWQRHKRMTVRSLECQGYLEIVLGERIALFFWRLKRLERWETDIIQVNLSNIPKDMQRDRIFEALIMHKKEPEVQSLQEFDNEISRRRIPASGALERIQRYESHLHRQLMQTLHELEAIQARRRGERTPLARLDITAAPTG